MSDEQLVLKIALPKLKNDIKLLIEDMSKIQPEIIYDARLTLARIEGVVAFMESESEN